MGCRLKSGPVNVRLRSPNRGNANNTWNVNSSGNVNNNNANNANRGRADCISRGLKTDTQYQYATDKDAGSRVPGRKAEQHLSDAATARGNARVVLSAVTGEDFYK